MRNVRSLLAGLLGPIVIFGIAGCPSSAPPKVVDVEPIDAGSAGQNASTVRDSTTPGSTPAAKPAPGGAASGPKAPPIAIALPVSAVGASAWGPAGWKWSFFWVTMAATLALGLFYYASFRPADQTNQPAPNLGAMLKSFQPKPPF